MFPLFAGSNPSGYNLTRSLRLRSSASAYLSRTPSVAATSNKIFTISFWAKPSLLVPLSYIWFLDCAGQDFGFYYNASYTAAFQLSGGANYITTSQVFRDPASWYHMVIAVDTTQATAANRLKFYVNGSQVTAFSSASYPAQNTTFAWNQNGQVQYFGRNSSNSAWLYDGYLAEFYSIDGQALTPSSFGSTNALTGVWQPARYTGSYGTNGFYLPFTDNSALTTASNVGLGKDFSGNANYWVTNNISITAGVTYDSMTDVPTLTSATAANFAVGNPLYNDTTIASTWTNGNLAFSVGNAGSVQNTFGVTSGKWYWETVFSSNAQAVGVMQTGTVGRRTQAISYASDGSKYVNATNSAYGSTYTTGDVIGIALDMNGGTIVFYKNNVSQGSIALSGATITIGSALIAGGGGSASVGTFNFGQQPFTYTPPTGFVALNTYNLPDSTIVKGNTVMDATLYTGTGASLSVTNTASFKPDLVWVKSRSAATDHAWYDSVRGTTKQLESNTTTAETTEATGLTTFGSAGFTVGALAQMNTSAATYVGWQWQAGQGSSSSNTNGTITSTVSVNASAGFSVVTYTGTGANATVGHGLGVAPAFIIAKSRGAATNWGVWHTSLTAYSYFLLLNTTAVQATAANSLQALPTSTLVSLGASSIFNDASTMVMYCWTPIAGYSAFGSWQNNNSTDGTFVYLGFSPAVIILKNSDNVETWYFRDIARQTYNVNPPSNIWLQPNTSNTEAANSATTAEIDVLSNGFKIRTTNPAAGEISFGTRTYIYGAWAANPFKNSLAR